MLRAVEDLVCAAVFDSYSIFHNKDFICHICNHAHVVSDEQDGRIEFVFESAHQI